jgi:hypothetical protein
MNAQEERNHALRKRAADWREERLIDMDTQRAVDAALPETWRTYGVVAQCVFFVLTLVGMAATYGLAKIISIPATGLLAGLGFIAAAEFLILQKWASTGVESALWIGGLVSMISELPHSGAPEAMLVLGAACAIAGARVRNPLFGAAAACFIVAYAETKFDLGVIVALVIAAAALVALLRTWRRPSSEWLWIVIALVLPVAGVFAADEQWRTVTIILYAMFGFSAIVMAIARRHHALYLAAAIGFTVAAGELARSVARPVEAKLAVAGACLLALAFVVARALRSNATGLVVTPAKLTGADEALSIAGALAAQQTVRTESPADAAEPGRVQGEGGFGGAGATGDY